MATVPAHDDPIDALGFWGAVMVVFCPIVGFACGAILASKNAVTRGVLVMLASVISTVAWSVFVVPEFVSSVKDDDSDAFDTACYTLPEDRTAEQQELVDAAADPSCL